MTASVNSEDSEKKTIVVTSEMDSTAVQKILNDILESMDNVEVVKADDNLTLESMDNVEVVKADDNLTADIPTDDLQNPFYAIDSYSDYFNEIGKYSMSSITGERPSCSGLKNKPKKNRSKIKSKRKAAKKAKRKNRR
jgi:hypothetical protein